MDNPKNEATHCYFHICQLLTFGIEFDVAFTLHYLSAIWSRGGAYGSRR
jgi:hypothetical protein